MDVQALMDQVAQVGVVVELAADAITDPGTNANLPGLDKLAGFVGSIKYAALYGCLAALFIGGGVWGVSSLAGNNSTVGRRFAIGGTVGAIVVGLGTEIVNTMAAL